jgi:5'-nucleotidase
MAQELYEKYHPVEVDSNIPIEQKKDAMLEWWTKHFDLLIQSGLNESILNDFSEKMQLYFREGVFEFLDLLKGNAIPLIIISSSGLGTLIPKFFEKYDKLTPNIQIIANVFEFNKKGNVKSIKQPIIHSLNKDEEALRDYPIFKTIKNRKNVILLGDSIGDLDMVKGFDYDEIIKIGFLNDEVDKNLENYKKLFDIVITEDGSFDAVNELLDEML